MAISVIAEDVAIDHDRRRELAIACALFDPADVDDHRAGVVFGGERHGLDAIELGPCLGRQLIDRAAASTGDGHDRAGRWVSCMRTMTTTPDSAVSAATA